MDSFELNKIAGGILLALLVVLGTSMLSEIIFDVEKPEKPGYEVEVSEDTTKKSNDAKKDVLTPILPILQNANIEAGGKIFKAKCSSCHTNTAGGANLVGPNLYNIVGKKVAYSENYKYSKILKKYNSEGVNWDYENLNAFLRKPKAYAKGTKMGFVGIKKDSQRADVIIYLRSLSENPVPLN